MATDAISGLGNTYTTAVSGTDLTSEEVTREDFLTLLIAQIQNQDPLNPMENQEFVAELATFSSLEQQTNQTELLEQILAAQNGTSTSQALSLIGQDVVAAVDTFNYQSGDTPTFLFQATSTGEAVVNITSSSGTVVRTETLQINNTGNHVYEFDGLGEYGNELAPGEYTISIGSPINEDGETEDYDVYLTGQVSEVQFQEGLPVLMVGNQTVYLSDVKSVRYRDEADEAV